MGKPLTSPAKIEWLLAHVGYQGDDCIAWPFDHHPSGYGQLWYEGAHWYANQLMCTLAHGQPPQDGPRYVAAHSCGHGNRGCLNQSHLSWKTHAQNSADMLAHGTAGTARQKLTRDDATQIRDLTASLTQQQIATRFGVSAQNVRHILHGRTHVRERGGPRRFAVDERARLVARAAELRASHVTYEKIGEALGISRLSARNFVHEANKFTDTE